MFVRTKKRGNRTSLMIVKNVRVNGKVKQTVLHSLGRLDILPQNGGLDALSASAQRFSEESAVLNAHAQGESVIAKTRAIGPSLVFEKLWKKPGVRGDAFGRYGNSKDHRPDRKQMVVGMVLDNEGRPVRSEIWPGNTADVKTELPIVERLCTRFNIGTVCIVDDRGTIGKDTGFGNRWYKHWCKRGRGRL